MTSTYTDNIGVEKPETGDQVGTWGITDNLNYDIVDQAISGYVSVTLGSAGSSGSPNDFDITDGALSNGRNPFISFTDAGDLGADVFVRLTSNAHKKIGWIENNLSGSQDLYVFQGTYNASNDYVIPAGQRALLRFDGGGTGAVVTNVLDNVRIEDLIHVGNLTVGGTLGVTGATTLSSTLGVTGATTLTGGLAGNPTVNTGNLVIGTAGKGVDFSANAGTAVSGAATTSELFDFYEEGTFVPHVVPNDDYSQSKGQTYSTQSGTFTRIGRCVLFEVYIVLTSLGTMGNTRVPNIGPLPYVVSDTNFGLVPVELTNFDLTATNPPGVSAYGRYNTNSGASYVQLNEWHLDGAGTGTIKIAELDDTTVIRISGHYIV